MVENNKVEGNTLPTIKAYSIAIITRLLLLLMEEQTPRSMQQNRELRNTPTLTCPADF